VSGAPEGAVGVGCCGLPLALTRYAGEFRAVELNSTFYRLPQLKTAARWRERAPEPFRFTLKALQAITHPASSPTYRRFGKPIPDRARENSGYFRPTDEVSEAHRAVRAVAATLGAEVVLFQTPASFAPTRENIQTS